MKTLITFRTVSLLLIMLVACSNPEKLASQNGSAASSQSDFFAFISSARLPDKLEWCGESVPLDIPEVRERAEREFYLLLQQPGQIVLYIKRGGRLFPQFEKIISDMGMPDDLKYLSVAESALYISISDKGALGLWQLMPETAQKLGLQVDDNIDERMNTEKSTRAALKYLKDGYNQFGSWAMAAAGYNMGYSNLAKSSSIQSSEKYFDLYLNSETSRFLFRIALIKEFMVNADKYGFVTSKIEKYKPDEFTVVQCREAVEDLNSWAKSNKTTYKDLKLLNPWIKKNFLPAPPKGKIYEIAVPK